MSSKRHTALVKVKGEQFSYAASSAQLSAFWRRCSEPYPSPSLTNGLTCVWPGSVQEKLYQRSVVRGGGKAVPEVRLYSSAGGALLFAVGCFGFAWTAREWIHWCDELFHLRSGSALLTSQGCRIVPCIFIVLLVHKKRDYDLSLTDEIIRVNMGIYTMYLATYSYLGDVYDRCKTPNGRK